MLTEKTNWHMDHIGIATSDPHQSSRQYQELMGYAVLYEEVLKDEALGVIFLGKGAVINKAPNCEPFIELIYPLEGNVTVARFLEKRGAGIHHICYRVPGMAEGIRHAKECGLTLLPNYPRPGSRNKEIAFFHPVSTGGVLIEICSTGNNTA